MKNNAMRILVVGLLMLLVPLCLIDVSYADNAEVLPKGITRVRLKNKFFLPIEERYDPDGNVEDIDANYNTDLNSSVFPGLGAFGPGATIGRSIVSFELNAIESDFYAEHGVTDKLTVGIRIPYRWIENNVVSSLDTSAATVGKNSTVNNLWPMGAGPGTTVVLTADDVQDILGGGLDITGDGTIDVAGFGYKRIETWSGNGVRDMEAGFRYQYLKRDPWRLAFTGALRLPTGAVDDADSLVDLGFGTGAYSILFHSNNDYTGIEDLVLNATLRYDLVLPAKETLRIPSNPNLPITTNKEEVDRDIGDSFELELSGDYSLSKAFHVALLYNYKAKSQDSVKGTQGFAYDSLERETDRTSHIYIVGLSYTTVPMYLEKSFPVPLKAAISYRNRFAGSNNSLKSEYIGLGLQVYF